ncbi:MAG: hypothetical protein UHH95_03145 [Oscillospiraceae bacterium]|nr:hypothetical protein [Oscillospiraceae bacterium]
MIKLIIGNKGTGKTKKLIELVHDAVKDSKGNVLCVEKGATLTYDLKPQARLIDTDSYEIKGYDMCYAFLAGLLSGNYDITDVFIDSIIKIGGRDFDALAAFLEKIDKISADTTFVFTISADAAELPAGVTKYETVAH